APGEIALEPKHDASDRVMHIDLEPIDPPVIFLPPTASGLRIRSRSQSGLDAPLSTVRGAEGELRYQPLDDRGLKYDVYLSKKNLPTFQRVNASERSKYLALPGDLPDRIHDLAVAWTHDAPMPIDKARAIEGHLR